MTQEVKKGKKKQVEKENQKEKKFEKNIKENTVENSKIKYESSIRFPYQRVWSRSALIFPVLFIIWYSSKQGKEIYLAKQKEILLSRTLNIECSSDYEAETNKYPECVPEKCGRIVMDKLVLSTESDILLKIAVNGLNLGGSDGGASILDLHSGALSKGQGFIDIYTLSETKKIFNSSDFAIYKTIKTKIQHAIAHNFGIPSNKIFLTKPTFFSRMTNLSAKTIHDEYWHPHIDKETYKSFHYTTLLYLNDFGRDFEGGRFVFIDKNNVKTVIEPRKGRLSMFTSGSENLHAVEKVQSGIRYALTISFTCNPDAAISDPNYRIK
ncbi:2-oxoglutarate and iron-dependent oxygenase domain-containing protein 3 [Apis mellifera caucasica]|uniref:2-oxoglutarate and iron-dependent oxygenase domain-containing protein 3 n=1 Tax=Apis mellifera TaxID=7460 RepID=A0A7M7IJI4_APIME|nr:2-oxoglutarate and iron-dependent oxygenase domain-containing protein 3 [Apis mellifera]KAG6801109.1 2-oxoglutarate and iron-dependent oxygenase domain-containing protein 3 [Apis mellifera caucasica]KAG9430944.1 2-oxoglutarate and iron-dependent oxygenase domain-containing protein 3 [Apis mellifera carnica]|eukprot:XP_016769681.2 2-oxoglutarate and iron-dependent oxygenase domain-containing protein 3 [Apis mellifera]